MSETRTKNSTESPEEKSLPKTFLEKTREVLTRLFAPGMDKHLDHDQEKKNPQRHKSEKRKGSWEKAGCLREISKRGLMVGQILSSQPNKIFLNYNTKHIIFVVIIGFFLKKFKIFSNNIAAYPSTDNPVRFRNGSQLHRALSME